MLGSAAWLLSKGVKEGMPLPLTSMPHLYSSSATSSAVQTRSSCLWPPQASVSEVSAARTSGAHALLISAVGAVVSNFQVTEAGVAMSGRARSDVSTARRCRLVESLCAEKEQYGIVHLGKGRLSASFLRRETTNKWCAGPARFRNHLSYVWKCIGSITSD